MAKYKGHHRAVFLDGYAAGWKDGLAGGWKRSGAGQGARLRYTDAEPVVYRPGSPGRAAGVAGSLVTLHQGRVQPTDADLARLGPREACPGESFCPVAPGCHICGLTREEIAILDKSRKGGV